MTNNLNKQIQTKRKQSYFIRAAAKLLAEEGLQSLSIRKVAAAAGFNSATLYHYFSDFDELIYLAAISYIRNYAQDLPFYMNQGKTPIEKYLKIWECFCVHSFHNPEIFELLFFGTFSASGFTSHFKQYYEIFPEELTPAVSNYEAMLTQDNIYKREYIALKNAFTAENRTFSDETLRTINEMNILLYRGMLTSVQKSPELYPPEGTARKISSYMDKIISSFS